MYVIAIFLLIDLLLNHYSTFYFLPDIQIIRTNVLIQTRSSASIRTLPAVAMSPLPPCALPIPKWDVQLFKQPPR